MDKEETIRMYMNTHESKDNVVYTWILWNFDRLDKIWNNSRIYADHNLYEELEKEAYKDKFVVQMTAGGKYRACEPNVVKTN